MPGVCNQEERGREKAMIHRKNQRDPFWREKVLAKLWRKKAGGKSDYDDVLISLNGDSSHDSYSYMKNKACQFIFNGNPLSFEEWHIAVGCGFILTDLDYITFYHTRWHETPTHRAYGSREECSTCKRESAQKRREQRKRRGEKKALAS